MKTYLLLPVLVFLLLAGCNDSGTNVDPRDQNSSLLGYVNHGCGDDRAIGLQKTEARDELFKWSHRYGVLELNFAFSTYCDAYFEDSCTVANDTINLFLNNSQQLIAKCICEYTNTFTLLWSRYGDTHIILNYRSKIQPEYFALVDTVIRL